MLNEHEHVPRSGRLQRLVLVARIGVLMSLNAIGVMHQSET